MMNTSRRYLTVHGHFYQPPRENPWIESVEVQDSAAPYHDWNDRITAECYARNGASRIVNRENQILRIVNNYSNISYNFGPTLLSWLEEHAPAAYQNVLEADRASQERFGGHGSAMAQVYNHVIMPLASRRDKELQVRWGIADFEHRFCRKPEGMWLAETAADRETLEVLAENGIAFTVLAPHQCAAVRPLAARDNDAEEPLEGAELAAGAALDRAWRGTLDASVDTRRPYHVELGEGRSIAVFFYDGPRSRAIAFERLLDSGEGFARRLTEGFSGAEPHEAELVHVATDGESYGHHHRYGEMALSYALQYIEDQGLATVTNYGEFLENFPPKWEAQVAEATSWSCAHGIERWRSDCGCNGGRPRWNQRWRGPLRQGLDLMRDTIAPLAAKAAGELLKDWDGACERYIEVMLERSKANSFLREERAKPLGKADEVRVLQLLEMTRHLQLMYTSCGWFFDDISGIETVQIIAYAARVLELAERLFGEPAKMLEREFLAALEHAQSNLTDEGTGADIYRRRVAPLRVGLRELGAHYAVSSVFKSYGERARLFGFDVRSCGHQVQNSGRGRLISGEAEICSRLTHEEQRLFYAVLHFGDQNIAAGVKPMRRSGKTDHTAFAEETRKAMLLADMPAIIRIFDREFEGKTYTIRSLFADEQRRVTKLILSNTVAEAENSLIRLYENHASLLRFLSESELPRPAALALAASFAMNINLRRALESDTVDPAQVQATLAAAAQDNVELNRVELSFVAGTRMQAAMERLASAPDNSLSLDHALAMARAVRLLPFEPNLWHAQNIWHALAKAQAACEEPFIPDVHGFAALGTALGLEVQAMEAQAQHEAAEHRAPIAAAASKRVRSR